MHISVASKPCGLLETRLVTRPLCLVRLFLAEALEPRKAMGSRWRVAKSFLERSGPTIQSKKPSYRSEVTDSLCEPDKCGRGKRCDLVDLVGQPS